MMSIYVIVALIVLIGSGRTMSKLSGEDPRLLYRSIFRLGVILEFGGIGAFVAYGVFAIYKLNIK
jgi:hypothetical protein